MNQRPCLVYLHGFNSAPQSHKVQLLQAYLAERNLEEDCFCPALPPSGQAAIAIVEAEMARRPGRSFVFIGSSLGGFYATWLAEKHGATAALINPGIQPWVDLRSQVGPQRNLYTDERYELSFGHLNEWQALWVPVITPARYLLLVETGDEVLDYRQAVQRYAGARQIVVGGGDHSLRSFPEHIPAILNFAGFSPVAS